MHVNEPSVPETTMEEVAKLFTTMTEEEGLETAYRCFNARSFRDKLGIPAAIWNEMEPAIQDKVNEIRAKLQHPGTPPRTFKSDIPAQYPTMKSKDIIAN